MFVRGKFEKKNKEEEFGENVINDVKLRLCMTSRLNLLYRERNETFTSIESWEVALFDIFDSFIVLFSCDRNCWQPIVGITLCGKD